MRGSVIGTWCARQVPSTGSPSTSSGPVQPFGVRITIAGHLVFDGAQGGPVPFDREAARGAMHAPELVIGLDLGQGHGTGEAFGCDLTEAYVIENSEYTT